MRTRARSCGKPQHLKITRTRQKQPISAEAGAPMLYFFGASGGHGHSRVQCPHLMIRILAEHAKAAMPKRTSASISKKAHAKAEADFTTWLMMAKLGGF